MGRLDSCRLCHRPAVQPLPNEADVGIGHRRLGLRAVVRGGPTRTAVTCAAGAWSGFVLAELATPTSCHVLQKRENVGE